MVLSLVAQVNLPFSLPTASHCWAVPCSSVRTALSFPTSRKSCQEKLSPRWVWARDQYVHDCLRTHTKKIILSILGTKLQKFQQLNKGLVISVISLTAGPLAIFVSFYIILRFTCIKSSCYKTVSWLCAVLCKCKRRVIMTLSWSNIF